MDEREHRLNPDIIEEMKSPTNEDVLFYLEEMQKMNNKMINMQRELNRAMEKLKQQDQQLKTALEASEKAGKAKMEFLSRMSHDLRTPMNGILGLAELSKDEYEVDVLRDNMNRIQTTGEYLLSLINETLDYQRIESGKLTLEPQVIGLETVLESIRDIVRPSIEKKNIEWKIVNHGVNLRRGIRIDPVRFKQIFINLISNAVKFTPEGGSIELVLEHIKQDGMISHTRMTLTDTGIGMSEEFIKNKIFHAFSQENNALSANYAGSGLGLSIVKSLIELMGGTISVESKLGVGTKFTILMDLERVNSKEIEEVKEGSKNDADDVVSVLKDKHILLAEDHPLNAEIARRLLEKVGCKVTWVKNGEECCHTFADSQPGYFDAILMDIRMPVMDGLQATTTIRSTNRNDAKSIPIIAMTANAYEEDRKKSQEAGIVAHLAKPVNTSLLYETLSKYVSEKE